MKDRRQHPRIEIDRPLTVVDATRNAALGQIANLSLGGFLILTPQKIESNRVFQLRLETNQAEPEKDPIEFGAESLWQDPAFSENTYWAGFQIIDISVRARMRLAEYVEALAHSTQSPQSDLAGLSAELPAQARLPSMDAA
jgi:hypothetical protein